MRDGADGQALADVVVSLPDLDRSAISDHQGRYAFRDVPAGPQHLSIRRIGYEPRALHALVPAHGALQIDITLAPVPVQLPMIVVRSRVQLRGVDSGNVPRLQHRSVTLAQLRNDPLMAEPDGLLGLTGGEITAQLESPSGIHVRGGSSDHTRYLLDGIPVLSPYHSAGIFTAWNPDALERLDLSSSLSPAIDALSGIVSATTRSPGHAVRVQGGMSTSHGRLALDGPVGASGAGYLVSFRRGFPALVAPRGDASYLNGETQDLIAKGETPALAGKLKLLAYDSRNAISSTVLLDSAGPGLLRNGFEWSSRSLGAQWSRSRRNNTVRLQVWSASSTAEASWNAAVPLVMLSERQDHGLLVLTERSARGMNTTGGLRIEWSRTAYQVRPRSGPMALYQLNGETPLGSIFLRLDRAISAVTDGGVAVSGTSAADAIHFDFDTQLRWRPATPLVLSAGYGQKHQFSQSLRNPESVAGNIFPPDLYVGAGAAGIPVARNHRAVLAGDYTPAPGIRVSVQAHVSASDGLLLAAPRTGEPFATAGYITGSATMPGFSLDATASGSRYGLVARYGWQRIRIRYADSSYTPVYGSTHQVEAGAILFPSSTTSIRVGVNSALGRRATAVTGAFEWEACNLLDRGCEFGGSPQANGVLGGTRLPAYLRVDVGIRKHWHLSIAQRDVTLALFGTLTNLLGRSNVLTTATDPATGRTSLIEMRPRAPLVIGVDWRF